MRKKFSKFVFEQNAPSAGRIEVRDTDSPLTLRITTDGNRSLCVRTRFGSEQVRLTYPRAAVIENLIDARKWAQDIIGKCSTGIDPRIPQLTEAQEARRDADEQNERRFENVVETYIERRLRLEKKNRTTNETSNVFARYITPRWRHRIIHEITRRDINALLNDIFDGKIERGGKLYGGHFAADSALAQLRALFNWYATQDDDFTSPIVRGMARTTARERSRSRILSDEEISVMWPILETHGMFGAIVKVLLLTAQRREEVSQMAREEISGLDFEQAGKSKTYVPGHDCIWTIPAERYKTKRPNIVPLTPEAAQVIAAQDKLDDSDLVFTTTGTSGFSGWSKCKARLDAAMLDALRQVGIRKGRDPDKIRLEEWRLHDLRRTSKTLMARAGVRPDISERVLGHVISGVEGIYDRHGYVTEKREALSRLAIEIHSIVGIMDRQMKAA